MQERLLTVNGLHVYYRSQEQVLPAVDDVAFGVAQGEALGLVGESGAGKSSMALALMRLLPRNVARFEGEIRLHGKDCLAQDEDDFRRDVRWREIAMVFQGAVESLNPVLRVGDQMMEPLRLAGASKEVASTEASRLLDLVRLPAEVYGRYPHELSGGMKQRVLIAMSLVLKPKLLVLDEPTSALDVTVQAQIMDQLKDLKRDLGLTIIFITHDIALASDVCDTIGVMYAGRLAEIGPSDAVLREPRHPYTQLLLASIPRLHQDGLPRFIPGSPPDIRELPRGCRFHPRCPYVFDPCYAEEPPLLAAGEGHQARCWLVAGRQSLPPLGEG